MRYCRAAVRRRRLYLLLSILGLAVASLLALHTLYRRSADPAYDPWLRGVLVLLVLLGARQNLRQYRYAVILAKLVGPGRGVQT